MITIKDNPKATHDSAKIGHFSVHKNGTFVARFDYGLFQDSATRTEAGDYAHIFANAIEQGEAK